jgi:glycosyltransferase involved in cell wall biosynthesis
MPQISLIIPLYNAVKHLRACLDSVVQQTFSDFEVILVDDGSTDETVNIVAEYTSKYKNFKLISQNNSGVSSARNYGIETSAAPYIALLDQDDVLHRQALEILYYLIDKYKTDVSLFNVKVVQDNFVSDKSTMFKLTDLYPKVINQPIENFFESKKRESVCVWNKLYRREAIKGIEFPQGVQPAEDTVFSLKIIFAVKNMVKVNIPLLYYRLSSTSVMKKGIDENYIRSHAVAAEDIYNYFIKSGRLKGQYLEWMELYLSRFIFKSLISQPLRLSKDNRKYLLDLSHNLAVKFYALDAIKPELLGWRKKSACRFFYNKNYFWSKLFLK